MFLEQSACDAVDGKISNDRFEEICQQYLRENATFLGDAESAIEYAIEQAELVQDFWSV